jgi:hypothetical protein
MIATALLFGIFLGFLRFNPQWVLIAAPLPLPTGPIAQLKQLRNLLYRKIVTQQEFEQQKAKILG